jgi:hypothetical protein
MSVKFKFEKRLNNENKYADTKLSTRKNFYAVGHDEKGKSYLGNIEDATRIEAKNKGIAWAKRHGLTFEGIYSNN